MAADPFKLEARVAWFLKEPTTIAAPDMAT
jgi:hypothetical protein